MARLRSSHERLVIEVSGRTPGAGQFTFDGRDILLTRFDAVLRDMFVPCAICVRACTYKICKP